MQREPEIPEKSNLEITDDYTSTKIILAELVAAHGKSPCPSRERSLLVTKLEEALFWAGKGLERG